MRAIGSIGLLAIAACTLGAGGFAGKTCDTQADCPEPYVCAQVRPGGTSCELLHGLDTTVGDGGGGTGGGGGTTLPPDWCHDVSPIMMRTCISNCHGTDHSYTNSPANFRLDVYTVDGGLGAFDKAPLVSVQVQVSLMPPNGIDPVPTLAERTTVINWVAAGAVFCNAGEDGGTDGG